VKRVEALEKISGRCLFHPGHPPGTGDGSEEEMTPPPDSAPSPYSKLMAENAALAPSLPAPGSYPHPTSGG